MVVFVRVSIESIVVLEVSVKFKLLCTLIANGAEKCTNTNTNTNTNIYGEHMQMRWPHCNHCDTKHSRDESKMGAYCVLVGLFAHFCVCVLVSANVSFVGASLS